MQSTPVRPPKNNRSRDPVRDGLIVLCMSVVALALGIGLYLQFGLAFWLAVVAALSVYVALLSTHVLIRRSEQIDLLRQQISRLEGQPAMAAPIGASPPVRADAGAAAGAGSAMDDYWNISPGRPVAPASARPDAGASARAMPAPNAVAGPAGKAREDEAEQINAVIRKLAADITSGQAALGRQPPDRTPALDDSVAALHAAADAMRVAATSIDPIEPDAQTVAAQPMTTGAASARPKAPPPLPQARENDPARSRLAAVAQALERERFDVMLEPVLGLGDRRAQHFVVSLRLRDGLGDSNAGFGIDRIVPGSGLLPLLDAAKVESAARIAWRMEDRGKSGALFSQLSGESLVSDRFLNRFADTYRQGDAISGRLVLSFRQGELLGYSDMQWSTLRDMADLGFRFCLDDVTTLDQDFSALAAAGFTFCRLDADVFLEGLPTETGIVPAADICRHLASLELSVIVAGIADEAVSRRLQSYGVAFGQGTLFGGPRPVKADVLRNPHAAVA